MSNATAPRATLAREQTVIDDPTLNSAFEEPQAHFRFDENSITDQVRSGSRSDGDAGPESYGQLQNLSFTGQDGCNAVKTGTLRTLFRQSAFACR